MQNEEHKNGSDPQARERLEALVAALRDAAEGHDEPRFLALTHTGPDPDALGALVGVAHLLQEGLRWPVEIATLGRIHRAENLAMVRELDLDFANFRELSMEPYCGALLVDTQPNFGHTTVPDDLPLVAVFDHHQGPAPEPGVQPALAKVAHVDVRLDVGATSSIVWEYLHTAGTPLDTRTATALFCGVRYDTGDLAHNVSPIDEAAWFDTFRMADRKAVARIDRPALPSVYYRELSRSLKRARRHGPLITCWMGHVFNPETVAEMADFYLRMESTRWSLVGGEHEGVYYVSLRTRFGGGYAYPFLARLLEGENGSFGGHGRVAGGRIRFETGDEDALTSLEERLSEKALVILADELVEPSDVESGEALT